MADQPNLPNTDPAKPADGGAPPAPGAVKPPEGAKPPAAAKPNGAPKNGGGKPNGKPQGGGTEIRMSSKALRERIDRDAAAKIRRALGCTLEEAQARIKAAATPAAAVSTANADATAGGAGGGRDRNGERLTALERQNRDLRSRLDASKKKTDKVRERERDRRVALELRLGAIAVGILDEHADFALDQFAQAVRRAPDSPPKPSEFWPTLLKARPYLGRGVTSTTVDLSPTTAPPESRASGEEKPAEQPAGTPRPAVDVDKLTDEQFAQRTDKLYKFRVPA